MTWKRLLILFLLVASIGAEDLPKFKKPLPSRAEICAMGWPKFQTWCSDNLANFGEASLDQMARHYRDLKDEATANEKSSMSVPEGAQLEIAVKATTIWLYKRCEAAGGVKGGSIYGHLAPRLSAELADIKHTCVLNWGTTAEAAPNQWPQSYQAMAAQPLQPFTATSPQNRGPFQSVLKDEATALQEACKEARRLPQPSRQTLQKFLLNTAETINPNSRT